MSGVISVLIFFTIHWYTSLYFQSFFHHRYSAHRMFTMSKFWEKVFYIGSFIFQGSSYLSPKAYGILHRYHHAYADTEKDVHSPIFDKSLWHMMWRTRVIYHEIFTGKYPVEERFLKNLPDWDAFDAFACNLYTRLAWIAVYIGIYYWLGAAWWQYIVLLPIQSVIGPVHGAVINWFAHKIGYRNFDVKDTSSNILPVDFLMNGEGYHNNHHARPHSANFGVKWHEFDPIYPSVLLFKALGIIKMKKDTAAPAVVTPIAGLSSKVSAPPVPASPNI